MSNRLVLVVDDDASNREMLEHVLQAHGYNPMSTNKGSTAIRLAQEHIPVLVLADINMPEMDGFALTRAIRANSTTQHIPILLISGLIDPDEQRKEAIEAGANGLTERGLPIAQLIEQINALVPDA